MTAEIVFHVYKANCGKNQYQGSRAFFGSEGVFKDFTIGSGPSNDLLLPSTEDNTSRYAVVEESRGAFYITKHPRIKPLAFGLNGGGIDQHPHQLHDGDRLAFEDGHVVRVRITSPPQEKPLAKRVRIAVAMSDDGTFWSARGFSGLKDGKNQPDGFLREGAEMDMEGEEISTYRTHMVEVDIPLPPEAPLQATLVGDSQ